MHWDIAVFKHFGGFLDSKPSIYRAPINRVFDLPCIWFLSPVLLIFFLAIWKKINNWFNQSSVLSYTIRVNTIHELSLLVAPVSIITWQDHKCMQYLPCSFYLKEYSVIIIYYIPQSALHMGYYPALVNHIATISLGYVMEINIVRSVVSMKWTVQVRYYDIQIVCWSMNFQYNL